MANTRCVLVWRSQSSLRQNCWKVNLNQPSWYLPSSISPQIIGGLESCFHPSAVYTCVYIDIYSIIIHTLYIYIEIKTYHKLVLYHHFFYTSTLVNIKWSFKNMLLLRHLHLHPQTFTSRCTTPQVCMCRMALITWSPRHENFGQQKTVSLPPPGTKNEWLAWKKEPWIKICISLYLLLNMGDLPSVMLSPIKRGWFSVLYSY